MRGDMLPSFAGRASTRHTTPAKVSSMHWLASRLALAIGLAACGGKVVARHGRHRQHGRRPVLIVEHGQHHLHHGVLVVEQLQQRARRLPRSLPRRPGELRSPRAPVLAAERLLRRPRHLQEWPLAPWRGLLQSALLPALGARRLRLRGWHRVCRLHRRGHDLSVPTEPLQRPARLRVCRTLLRRAGDGLQQHPDGLQAPLRLSWARRSPAPAPDWISRGAGRARRSSYLHVISGMASIQASSSATPSS